MKIEKSDNVIPGSSPPAPGFDWLWESLGPCLVGKAKIGIIEAMIFHRKLAPPAPSDLVEMFPPEFSLELVRHHMSYLAEAGVLEVAGSAPCPDEEGAEPTYRLPPPPQGSGA